MLRRSFTFFANRPIESAKLSQILASAPLSNSWTHTKSSSNAEKEVITKLYTFKDFHNAFAFMTKSCDKINAMDHHPEWFNVYNKVRIELTTHDAGNKVSDKDIELARHFDEVAKQFEQQ